jgi:hypothetical protein
MNVSYPFFERWLVVVVVVVVVVSKIVCVPLLKKGVCKDIWMEEDMDDIFAKFCLPPCIFNI